MAKPTRTIKNYTSSVPASTTIARIEEMLVRAGARNIEKKYDEQLECSMIIFNIFLPALQLPLFVKLPANVEACYKALLQLHQKNERALSPSAKDNLYAQARRTAWKIMQDWLAVQLTLIELQQVELLQIFLSYAYNPATGETFYEHLKKTNYKQLTDIGG